MIRELANAERFPFAVTVTENDVRENLFGTRPAAEAHPFIRPEFQRRGFGLRLLRHVAAIAAKRSCGRFEWWALRTKVNAIRFYVANGERPMEELLIFRTYSDSLERLAGDTDCED